MGNNGDQKVTGKKSKAQHEKTNKADQFEKMTGSINTIAKCLEGPKNFVLLPTVLTVG
jgi:hypothetical protein